MFAGRHIALRMRWPKMVLSGRPVFKSWGEQVEVLRTGSWRTCMLLPGYGLVSGWYPCVLCNGGVVKTKYQPHTTKPRRGNKPK
ncbi:hypothetical protein V6N13_145147 [Hibiscus sabdariffa]